VAIVAGVRTPFAKSGTTLKNLTAIELGKHCVAELIQRLSQRLSEANDRIVKDERLSDRPHVTPTDPGSQTALVPANNLYLAAKDPWLQRQFHAKLALTDLPFVVGRGPVSREGGPPLHPDLKLDDTVPFRLSRNHFMIEKRDGELLRARPPQHPWNDRKRPADR